MANNIFFGLNIGRSALLAHQTAVDVTGHNLANVQTEGYSRQRVSMVQALPISGPQGPVGSGVNAERIQRLQLGYLDRQLAKVKTQQGYDSTLARGLNELQSLLGEPSASGVGAAMTELWNSWEALSAHPADASLREQVVERAEHFALVYNQKIEGLADQEANFDEAVTADLADVNAWAEKLSSLNDAIAQAESTGYSANDLRDQRDLLVQKVSEKLGVEAETDGAYLNVRLPGGGPYLVHRTSAYEIRAKTDGSGDITGFEMGVAAVTPSGGSMAAYMKLRNEVSPELRAELAEMAATVADRINGLHTAGYDRDGAPGGVLFGWEGEGDSVSFAPSMGLREVSPDADLALGTHALEVVSVGGTLVGNAAGTLSQGTLSLSQAAGTFAGPRTIHLDYHVRVLGSNAAAGSVDGLRVQLFRGDEAVGDARTVTGGAGASVTWTGIDGVDFTAAIGLGAGERFVSGERSDGLSTVGTVSLDGGAAVAVDLTTQNNLVFPEGTKLGYLGGGSAAVNFSGGPFSGATFTRYGAGAALYVNPEIAADTDKLAAAGAAPGGGPGASGDGETARRIGDLATQTIFERIGETAAGFLGRTVQSLGSKGRDAEVFEKASTIVYSQLEAQKQATSGVNTDEEMVNLMQYQRGFEAAARFLTTVDGMIDLLINRVGLAGR